MLRTWDKTLRSYSRLCSDQALQENHILFGNEEEANFLKSLPWGNGL